MKDTNTITFGAISINKKKLDEAASVAIYITLCIIRVLLLIATGCFIFLTVASAGDGRVNDETHPFLALGFATMCYLSAKIVGMITVMYIRNTRARYNKKYGRN